jgi:phenylalanyl-tRNA synthetase beta chain
LAGEIERPGWWGPRRNAGWADAINAARTIAAAARVELDVRPVAIAPFHPGRCAELLLAGEAIGTAGELHPRVVEALKLPERTCAMELNLDAFVPAEPAQTPIISAFPPVLLDLALVVDHSVPAATVLSAVRDGAGGLLESIRLFDVYTDPERLGRAQKSLAFSLKFRALDRTLTVDEATQARDAAIALANQRTGATLRL